MRSLEEYLSGYKYIPVICGPTASGKSDMAMKLCEACGGELVSCDSMQIYRGLDIGTAKPTTEDQRRVVHHMIDIVDPDCNYSVSEFNIDALASIDEVLRKGKLPVLCGGTGQYISALIKGIDYGKVPVDDEVVNDLYDRFNEEGIDQIYKELSEVDPEAAAKIHPNNTRRVIRAYAVYKATGRTFTEKNNDSMVSGAMYPFRLFRPDIERDELYDRINRRVDVMIGLGLVEEAKWLYSTYGDLKTTAFQAIGYKELKPYINGEISLDKAVYDLKLNSRHYAKRQLTWFRTIPDIYKISPESYKLIDDILSVIT